MSIPKPLRRQPLNTALSVNADILACYAFNGGAGSSIVEDVVSGFDLQGVNLDHN
jgi:hypothetical protein